MIKRLLFLLKGQFKLNIIGFNLFFILFGLAVNSQILAQEISNKTKKYTHPTKFYLVTPQNHQKTLTIATDFNWKKLNNNKFSFSKFIINPEIKAENHTFSPNYSKAKFKFSHFNYDQLNINQYISSNLSTVNRLDELPLENLSQKFQSDFFPTERKNLDLTQVENEPEIPYATQKLGRPPEGKFRPLTDDIFPTTDPHFGDDLSFKNYYQWKREISAKYGFDFVLLNAPIYQLGSKKSKNYFDNELDFLAQWRLFETDKTEGKFFFWLQYVQTFSQPTGRFAASQNLLTLPNAGATDPRQHVVAVSALWWEQSLAEGHFSYRIGQLYAPSLWGNNKYLGDDRVTFMNSVLSTTQGVNWPSRGIGATVTLNNDLFYASAGVQDATANQNGLDLSSLGDSGFFYLGEIGYTPKINNEHEGTYRLMVSYIDKTGDEAELENRKGWGMILSLQQDFSEQLGFFGIYRQSWGRFTSGVYSAAGAGLVINKPFGWDDDQVGFGYFYANPTNREFRDENGLEIYYKLQLTHRLEVTPSVQLYITPARNQGMILTPGLRLRYVL